MNERLVETHDNGSRLDVWGAEAFALPRLAFKRLCEAGDVRVNGKRAKSGHRLTTGDIVTLAHASYFAHGFFGVMPSLLHVDDACVVIDKPRGMPSHPLLPSETDTAANAVVTRFPECQHASPDAREGGAVHRLDNWTSGVLVFARSPAAFLRWRDAFDAGRTHKTYLALVHGNLVDAQRIDASVAHDATDKRRMRVHTDGQTASSHVAVLAHNAQATITCVRVTMSSGRRHQVRVHLAALGHPLVGDVLYGATARTDGEHWLHAESLTLGDARFQAPLPTVFLVLMKDLGFVDLASL